MIQLLTNLFNFIFPLWKMSLTAAFVALVVVLLRLLLKERAPRQVICVLWLIVFARLLIPISPQSPVSLVPDMGLEAPAPVISQLPKTAVPTQPVALPDPTPAVITTPEPVVTAPVTVTPTITVPASVATPPVAEPEAPGSPSPFPWQALAAALWLLGAAAMLVYGAVSYLTVRRRVRFAIRGQDGIWEDATLRSPFILGLLRPKIYLPQGLTGYTRHFILCHEQAHIRRRDYIVKPLCWLALAIHWFNPAAWAAFLLMSRDMEVACDQGVLRELGAEVKADYSATLLALATNGRFPAPTPLAFGEGDAKTRIKDVLSFKKPALWATIAAVVIAIVAAVCLLTDPVTFDPEDYTTSEHYPGLYFQEETDPRYGHTTAKAYKLVDGAPVLVAGYTLLPANNYNIIIHPDGTEEPVWAAPMDTLAAYEQYLAEVCLETDPDWAGKCFAQTSIFRSTGGYAVMSLCYTPHGNLLLTRDGRAQVIPLSAYFTTREALRLATLTDMDGDGEDELVLLWDNGTSSLLTDGSGTILTTGDHLMVCEWDGETWAAHSADLPLLVRDNLLSMRRYGDIPVSGISGDEIIVFYNSLAIGSIPYDGGSDSFAQGELSIVQSSITPKGDAAFTVHLAVCPQGNAEPLCYLTASLSYRNGSFHVDGMTAADRIMVEGDPSYTQNTRQFDYYPGIFFLEETGSRGLMALTAYKVVAGKPVDLAVFRYDPDSVSPYTVTSGDGSTPLRPGNEQAALCAFEELVIVSCKKADPDWLPADPTYGPYVTTEPAHVSASYSHIFRYTTPYGNLLFVDTRNGKTLLLPLDGFQITGDQWSLEEGLPILRAVLTKEGEADRLLVLKARSDTLNGTILTFTAENGGLQFINEAAAEREGTTLRLTHNLQKVQTTLPDADWLGEPMAVVSSDFTIVREEDDRYWLNVPVRVMDTSRGITMASFAFQGRIEDDGTVTFPELYITRTMVLTDTLEGQDAALYSDAEGTIILRHGSNAGPIAEELYPDAHSPYRTTLVSVEGRIVTLSYDGVESTLHETAEMIWSAMDREWIRPVTAENLAKMAVVGSLPSHDLTLYHQKGTLQFYLQYGGHIALLDTIIETGQQRVQFFPGDRNGDGMEEILILHHIGYGTGCDQYGLMACWVDEDGLHVERHDPAPLMAHFMANNSFTYEPAGNTLSLSYQGQRIQVTLTEFMKTQDWSGYGTAAVLTSEIVRYSANGDGTFTLSLAPALSDGVYLPEYLPMSLNYTVRFDGSSFSAGGGTLTSSSGQSAQPSAISDQTGLGQRYLSALRNETEILKYTGSGFQSRTLAEMLERTGSSLQISHMAAVDLDGDLVDELLLALSYGPSQYGTQILHYDPADGNLYGYSLFVRAFRDVKTDGTFTHSDSAFEGGIARLSFSSTGYDYEDIAFSMPVNGRQVYFIGVTSASEEEYNDLYALQSEKPAPEWVEYSDRAAEAFLTERFSQAGASLTVLDTLPRDIVTPETLPDDPDWYYKVAEAGAFNLYARNHGQEVLLQYGNLSWTFDHRAHSTRWSLPRMAELNEQTVAVISQVNTGTQVDVDELVVYAYDDATAMTDHLYDWRTIAGEFNRSNTLVYDRETNSFALTYGGETYHSGTLPEDFSTAFSLEDGFTGALLANGELVSIDYIGDNNFTITLDLIIASGGEGEFTDEWFWQSGADRCYPLSAGATGFKLTWNFHYDPDQGGFRIDVMSIGPAQTHTTQLTSCYTDLTRTVSLPMDTPITVQMTLPQQYGLNLGDIVHYAPNGSIAGVQGMLKLIQVSEDFVMDETIAQPWVADASGQPSPIDLAGNATAFPYTTATGHHIIICEYVYDGDQWPGLIYAYFRVSPQLVLRLQMCLGDHMANAYTYIDSLQFMGQISP